MALEQLKLNILILIVSEIELIRGNNWVFFFFN